MKDTYQNHPDYNPEVVALLNSVGRQRLSIAAIVQQLKDEAAAKTDQLTAKINELKAEIEDIETTLAISLGEYQYEIDEIDEGIIKTITENRKWLTSGKIKSFTTAAVIFRLRRTAASSKVDTSKDAKAAIMQVAHEHNVVRQVANPPKVHWQLSIEKLLQFIKDSGHHDWFAKFIKETPEGDTVNIAPLEGKMFFYNDQRISPSPTRIEGIIPLSTESDDDDDNDSGESQSKN